jgi:hypothetical protein
MVTITLLMDTDMGMGTVALDGDTIITTDTTVVVPAATTIHEKIPVH